MRVFITGATGFVGKHVAEAFRKRDASVVALVRPTSKTADLERMGVELVHGDLADPASLKSLLADVDVVVNCAAKVGDWGPIDEYRKVNVEGLRALLEAAKGQALDRFIHVSSLGVYEARHHHGTDEDTPPGTNHSDGYSKSKAEAEGVALKYHRDFGVPVVILRPGFVYGPGDVTVMPKIIAGLKNGEVRYPGGGHALLNTIFIRNLVDAVMLACASERAVGQVYNLTDGEVVSKRRFIERVADAYAFRHPHLTPPLWLAKLVAIGSESFARMRGSKDAPKFNRTKIKFLGLNLDFSIEKAKRELGYSPRYSFDQGMAETMNWCRENLPE